MNSVVCGVQDFLRRIPSTSNLAAQASAQGLDAAQQRQLVQTAQQMQAAQQAQGLGGGPLSGQLQEPGRLNVSGIPRVPSLDLLRQLVQVNQGMSPGNGGKAPASSAAGARTSAALRSAALATYCVQWLLILALATIELWEFAEESLTWCAGWLQHACCAAFQSSARVSLCQQNVCLILHSSLYAEFS